MSFSLVVLIYVILGLMEVDDAARRLRGMKNQEAGRVIAGRRLPDRCEVPADTFSSAR